MTKRLLRWVCGVALLALLGAVTMPEQGLSQEKQIEVSATYSYLWAGGIDTYEGTLDMQDGATWGGTIDYAFRRDAKIELSYSYTASHVKFQRYYYGTGGTPALENLDNPMSIQYFQIGSIYQIPKGKAQPFFGLLLGAVLASPSGTAKGLQLEDQWSFAVSLNGGVKFYMSEQFGIRLQGRLLLPMYFSGGSVYVGTGGTGVAMGAGIPVVQGDLGAGIFVSL